MLFTASCLEVNEGQQFNAQDHESRISLTLAPSFSFMPWSAMWSIKHTTSRHPFNSFHLIFFHWFPTPRIKDVKWWWGTRGQQKHYKCERPWILNVPACTPLCATVMLIIASWWRNARFRLSERTAYLLISPSIVGARDFALIYCDCCSQP